jgi:hypothetical protein
MRDADAGRNPLPGEEVSTSAILSCLNLAVGEADPTLARLVEAWPTLPLPIRVAIAALVDASGK